MPKCLEKTTAKSLEVRKKQKLEFDKAVKMAEQIAKKGLHSLPDLVNFLACFDTFILDKYMRELRTSKSKYFTDLFRQYVHLRWVLPMEVIQQHELVDAVRGLTRAQLETIAGLRTADERRRYLEDAGVGVQPGGLRIIDPPGGDHSTAADDPQPESRSSHTRLEKIGLPTVVK